MLQQIENCTQASQFTSVPSSQTTSLNVFSGNIFFRKYVITTQSLSNIDQKSFFKSGLLPTPPPPSLG